MKQLAEVRELLERLERVEELRRVAKEFGYAVAVHGTAKRDIDLIAAPWVKDAAPAEELISEICERLNLTPTGMTRKPHGRKGWLLYPSVIWKRKTTGVRPPPFDISVMPRRAR